VLEYAVRMVEFPQEVLLSNVLARDELSPALIDALAAKVAQFHANAPRAEAHSPHATPARVLEAALANVTEIRIDAGEHADRALLGAIERWTRQEYGRIRDALRKRHDNGSVRECHGDLHLGNIALLEGRPVPFDAIEFDPDVAAGDVLYDLAFLLMDLLERGLGRAANIVMNGYFAQIAQAEDLDGLAALPFFLSLRAAIRAKVTAARLQYAESKDYAALSETAKTYFQLAVEQLSPPPPTLIAIGGLSGTGKSSLARELAPHVAPAPGALLVRSDVERKRFFRVAETEHLPSGTYSAKASAKVYGIVADKAARVIVAGHSAIVDAVFAKQEERTEVEAIAASADAAFRGLFLVADLQTRLNRVGTRGLDASDANATVAVQQESYALGSIAWVEIDASGSLLETLERARAAIR